MPPKTKTRLNVRRNISPKEITYKNMYNFVYNNPSTKKYLYRWDAQPLVIPLDITKNSLLAINIHWLPKAHRAEFLDLIIGLFDTDDRVKRRKNLRLFYMTVKRKYPKYLKGIRRYHIGRMKKIDEFPYETWHRLLRLPPKFKKGGAYKRKY